MPSLLCTVAALLAAALLPSASGLTCHVCRSQPPSATAPAAANSTLGLILTLALHSPPDCDQFSGRQEQFHRPCPLGLNSTCAVARDSDGRQVRTCFGAARGAVGCFSETDGTYCLCRGDLCNTASGRAAPLVAALVASVGLAMALC